MEDGMARRTMMMVAVAAVLGGCAPAMVAGGGLPTTFLGTWEGRGSQTDQPGEWTIRAHLVGGQPGAIIGTIAYPSLDCTGDLTLRLATPTSLEVVERISEGECVDGGTITLTAAGDGRLRFDWRLEGYPATAEGMLQRVRS
jgi:hypothetical protein